MHEKKHLRLPMQEVEFNHFSDVKLYQLESKFLKKNPKQILGSFWFKVMNSPLYSIQREVIKEFESFKSKI